MNEQIEAYEGSGQINSDPWGIIDRDNRNHRKKCRKIISHTKASPGDAVLEVGCGHGLHSREYAERYDLTAIDLSGTLVDETRSATDARVMQCDATRLPFDTDSFQATVGAAIAHHLPDWETALEEWIRVTRSGGSVTLAEPNYLFPKETVSTHVQEEEQYKNQMAPWRVKRVLQDSDAADWSLTPFLHTPPWPASAVNAYDAVDKIASELPAVRWLGQMLLIHLDVP